MADLKPLIRVRKHIVEQKQKFLAGLYKQADDLQEQKGKLEERLKDERENVRAMDVQMLSYFGPYAEAVRGRVEKIREDLGKLETRIQIAREDMRSAFAEMKKIEITQGRREAEQKRAADKKESDTLDETGLDTFRRKKEKEF